MPFININVGKSINAETKVKFQKEIAENISLLPGKNAGNTIICITDCCVMFKNGEPFEGFFADIRLYKNSPEDAKKAFAEKFFAIIEEVLEIPRAKTQFNFSEMPVWVTNGNYLA
ncbi:MAG: hypothetical protein FWF15_08035 [Oscillospiraceae bacterium]|nr:hypothetical protein [Oscillospiraceae bacterium]